MSFSDASPLGLETGLKIVRRYDLRRRLRRAEDMARHYPLDRLLRFHVEEAIRSREIPSRDNLDEFLAGIGLLHIAGFGTREQLHALSLPIDRIIELLRDEDVCRYYEDYYPFAPPILFVDALEFPHSGYALELSAERCREGWEAAFHRFLVLDATFTAAGPLEYFLSILDDYVLDDFDIGDLKRAFRSEAEMARFLDHETGRLIVEGVEDFFEFSEDLAELLSDCSDYPLLQSLIWLNYGYWYGAGGERMRNVADWVEQLLVELDLREGDSPTTDYERFERLRSAIGRLTDAESFIMPIYVRRESALAHWMASVSRRWTGSPRSLG